MNMNAALSVSALHLFHSYCCVLCK